MKFQQSEVLKITEDARRAFQCDDRAVRVAANRKQRDRDRKRVDRITERFFTVMNSVNPPKEKDQAMLMILPIWWMVLNVLWSEFARRVADWLWENAEKK